MTDKSYCIQILYVLIVLFTIKSVILPSECNQSSRFRRHLSFRNNSKFLIRIGIKNNMVSWTQMFAEAYGFRLNFDEPPDTFHKYLSVKRRDLNKNLEAILDQHGIDGKACVKRAYCDTSLLSDGLGVYNQLLRIIFKKPKDDTDILLTPEDCIGFAENCPLSLLNIVPYTDI